MRTSLSYILLFVGLACSEAHQNDTTLKNIVAELPRNPRGKIWALLVAGSQGWRNYRHQADICSAYQLLHSNGIPDENIIVMMYDDIASYQDNPTPGEIINYPGGPDVYKGVPKDYTGKDVTAKNFLNILAGNKTAMNGVGSGKVVESGPDDLVFINFVDHGGVGVLYFPNGELLADDLLKTINLMHIQSKYSKLVMYVEACHAGSMFDDLLPESTNVFVMAASDPHESSYACYYDEDRQTYLSDVFSVEWMNDTEHGSSPDKSLHHQYQKVRTNTNTSHVEEYGDLDVGVTKLKDVLGFKLRLTQLQPGFNLFINRPVFKPQPYHPMDTADNMDVPLDVLENKKSSIKDKEKMEVLESEIDELNKKRNIVNHLINEIIIRITGNIVERKKEVKISKYGLTWANFPCYKKLYTTFSNNCISFISNPYARVHLQRFINICSTKWLKEDKFVEDIKSVCSEELGSTKHKNIM